MKINNVNKIYGKQVIEVEKNKKNIEGKKENATKPVDVNISNSARKLAQIITQKDDSIFSERVESIKKAISENRYEVSNKALGEKLISFIEEEKVRGN